MWQDKLKEVIYILEHSDVNEIEVRFWGKTYRVVKSASASPAAQNQATVITKEGFDKKSIPVLPVEDKTEETGTHSTIEGENINSPMPGTFYRASSPEDEPFIKEGDHVEKGDTLCIIEAMKIMNEIEAEINGTIEKVLVDNGSSVEYDQPLFVLNPK